MTDATRPTCPECLAPLRLPAPERDLLDLVREFHDAAQVPTPDAPCIPDVTPSNRRHIKSELLFAVFQLRIAHRSLQSAALDLPLTAPIQRVALMIEELRELIEAIAEGDLADVLKEAEDLLYVTFGTLLRFGLQGCHDEAAAEVHRSNMAKCVAGPDGPRMQVDERGKITKPEGWVAPNLSGIVERARAVEGGE